MAKKKKTRKQKILADLRRQARHMNITTPPREEINATEEVTQIIPREAATVAYSPVQKDTVPKPAVVNRAVVTADYQYLSRDLLKTIALTISIVVVEVVIHFLTRGIQ